MRPGHGIDGLDWEDTKEHVMSLKETNLRFFGNKCSAFNEVKSYINLSLIFASPYLRLRLSNIWNKSLCGLSLSNGRFLERSNYGLGLAIAGLR